MLYYIYVIQSRKDNSYYTGITKDLKKRFKTHNTGGQRFTSAKRPYRLIWYCAFGNENKAYQFEKYLKSGSGIAFLQKRLI